MAITFYDVEWSDHPDESDGSHIFQRRFHTLKDAQDCAIGQSEQTGDVVYVIERRTNDDLDEPAITEIAEWVYSCGALERVEQEAS